ncbi:MAG: YaaA family protein [Clostridiales bacterium]|jgi:cytoplasmic iron level regulating protein YaaA (DUF328/UPF0246 family)|nr:YaaA family protein [Clostridiales bacterium]
MRFILSPARNFNSTDIEARTKPLFVAEAKTILDKLKKYAPWELEGILNTNGRLAFKSFEYLQDFDFNKVGMPALFAYNGLVYKYFDPLGLDEAAVEDSQSVV